MTRALVHGFSQTESSWDFLAGPDATALRVPDGHGFVDTAALLGEAGGRATYVGYSMGGRLCLQLALDRPELVERLVLISASPGIADDAERAARAASDEELAQQVERDGVDVFLEHWLAQPLFSTVPFERSGFDDRRAGNTVERLTHQLRVLGQGTQPNNWPRLGELQMPVWLVAGNSTRSTSTSHIACTARSPERVSGSSRVPATPVTSSLPTRWVGCSAAGSAAA